MRKVSKFAAVLLLVLALAVVSAACGEEETTEEAKQQLMTDLQAFETTVNAMASLSATSTVEEWKSAREDTQEAWDKVVTSAADVKEAEINNVQSAWDELAKAVDDLPDDATLQDALPQLTEELNSLKAAYDDLYNGLQ